MNHSHGGMDMGDGADMCKVDMLWNWYTIDACECGFPYRAPPVPSRPSHDPC